MQAFGEYVEDGTASAMKQRDFKDATDLVAFSCKDHGNDSGAIAPTLRGMGHDASHANGGGQVAVAFKESQSGARTGTVHATLDANKGSRRMEGVMSGMSVRRLTPTDCERLQGFSDGHTAAFSDSTRYRMLGNAVCVNVAEWIANRLAKHMETHP